MEKKLLYKAIEKLNHREKVIVEMRYGLNNKDGEEMTQKEVASFMFLSGLKVFIPLIKPIAS